MRIPLKKLGGILLLAISCANTAISSTALEYAHTTTMQGKSLPVHTEQKTAGNIKQQPATDIEPQHNTAPIVETAASIVLILDDLGNSLTLGQRAIELPGKINYSFLPQSPNGPSLAHAAHQLGKEIMLHVPMSNVHGIRLGPGALTPAMEKQQFIATLRQNLLSIPHVKGVNNHMGSLLTQLRQPMSWLIQELKHQQLYFIDSRTSPLTVAESLAKSYDLPHLRRNIFLDNQRTRTAISEQFEKLIRLARQQGSAVAIAHPHPQTLEFLEQALPNLHQRQVKLVFASEMLNKSGGACTLHSTGKRLTGESCSKLSQSTTAKTISNTIY